MWRTETCRSPAGVHWTTGVQDYKWMTSDPFIRLPRRFKWKNPPPLLSSTLPPQPRVVKARHSTVFAGSWKRDRSIWQVLLYYFRQTGISQSVKWMAIGRTAGLRFLVGEESLFATRFGLLNGKHTVNLVIGIVCCYLETPPKLRISSEAQP